MDAHVYPNMALRVPIAGRGAYPPPPKKLVARKEEGITTTVVYREQFPVAVQPFDVKERRVVEHQTRTSHRRHIPQDLVKVVANWVDSSIADPLPWQRRGTGAAPSVVVSGNTAPIPPAPAPSGDGGVNVRLLVVPPIAPADADSVATALTRITVVAAAEAEMVKGYGGLVAGGADSPDAELKQAAAPLIVKQCGVDFAPFAWQRLVEYHYKAAPPTVYFVPVLTATAAPLALAPQVAPANPPDEPAVCLVAAPLRFTLAALRNHEVSACTPRETLEFLGAVDALDEWGQRKMARVIHEALRERGEEHRILGRLQNAKAERMQLKRRRRDQEVVGRKKARHERDMKLKDRWGEEDEGKTDEDKRAAMQARQAVWMETRELDAEEDAEAQKRWGAEDMEEEEPVHEREVVKTASTVREDQLDAFQYFDNDGGYSLPRLLVQNLLLCDDAALSLGDVDALLNLPVLPRRQEALPYRKLAVSTVPAPTQQPAT